MLRILSFLVVFLVPSVAFAADAPALASLLNMLLDILLPIAALLASWGAFKFLKWFEKKTGMDIPDRIEQKVDRWVDAGIDYAEELARRKLKEGEAKLTMGQKKEAALSFVLDMAEQYNGPELARETLEKMLEAKLGYRRPPANARSLSKPKK